LTGQRGFTVVEMTVTAAIIGILAIAIAKLFSPTMVFYQRTQARQKVTQEARICMETMEQVLSNGKSSSLNISTPVTTPTVQFSQASFESMDGTSYVITWSTSPLNSVHLQHTLSSGVINDKILATNVTGINFGIDVNDPAIVNVTLQMTAALDNSGSPDSIANILLPTQTVRMISR